MITNKKNFDEIIENQIKNCKDLLNVKFTEYQHGEDLLSNFNNIAKMLDIEPITAWMGLWTKHVESIITRIHRGQDWPCKEWDEKITDCINYLLLLQCILHQHMREIPEQTYSDRRRAQDFKAIGDLGNNMHGMGMPSEKESEEE